MDAVTQAALGAACALACFGRVLGRRAALWGALGALVPDVDALAAGLQGAFDDLRRHRGLTHALWFAPVAGTLIGYGVWRLHAHWKRARATAEPARPRLAGTLPDPGDTAMLGTWMGLFVVALLAHPLLDLFTTYGVALFWPFSDRRFALDAVAAIDPLYTVLLAAGVVAATRAATPRLGRLAASAALGLSTVYLLHGVWLNHRAVAEVRRQLAAEGVWDAEVSSYPTLLQTYLRRVVVRARGEVRVGLVSMWRRHAVRWRRFSVAEHPLVEAVRRTPEGRLFERIARGQTWPHVTETAGGYVVEIEDLRYGVAARPDEALGGIRAFYDRQGRLMGAIQRFNRWPRGVGRQLTEIWRAAFG